MRPLAAAHPAVAEIKSALGPTGWLEGADMAASLVDFRGVFRGAALIVARPGSTEEVQRVVRICAAHGLAVVAQGGNTSLSGGAVPPAEIPAVVLSLARMTEIVAVDPASFSITAAAGATILSLQEAAEAAGRALRMDWGARGTATVGGAIATNAGGLDVLAYGNTREQVLGLEVVLGDGRVWNGARGLRKDSSGYDLKHLFIGSEGTLGVITKAVLRLHPQIGEACSGLAALSDVNRLMEFLALARAHAGSALTAFEIIPGIGVARAPERVPTLVRPITANAEWFVLLRVTSRDRAGELLADLLAAAHGAGLVGEAVVASSQAQEANLWHLRDAIPALFLYEGKPLKFDVAVPIDRIPAYIGEVERTVTKIAPGAMPYIFGHAGDGNLHLTVWEGSADPAVFEREARRITEALDRAAWDLGGTISAEHGIGQELIDRIGGQKPEIEFEMMRQVKRLFDPAGILNPGKMLRM
jgi:FAD/FMN-containing dehydrogenase